MKSLLAALIGLGVSNAQAAQPGDYLVKFDTSHTSVFRSGPSIRASMMAALPADSRIEDLGLAGWHRLEVPKSHLRSFSVNAMSKIPGVLYVQPNYKIKLLDQPGIKKLRAQIAQNEENLGPYTEENCPVPGMCNAVATDNPAIPAPVNPGSGNDPLFNNQWGMLDIGVSKAWNKSKGSGKVVVAIIDTGVDYTHEDLVENLWRNKGEMGTDSQGRDKATNGIDDDNNGYIDDQIGWDFVSNDNKPFDLVTSPIEMIISGGNPGHGTHCAGNVAARGFNGKGVSGVAPNVSIMALRFLSEKGAGTTAGAIQAINYALRNGARITSNSWGSEGEDSSEAAENKALRDVIQASQNQGVLFVAAAGNGHGGAGYNNDTDAKPGVPASYDNDIIVSVAALNAANQLGSFSNWGIRSVDIGAPGVKVYSTTVGNKYSDTVLDMLGMVVTWDGTSMAAPHVAGAAALYLSTYPNAPWNQIKAALISSATPIPSMAGMAVSNGKLNVEKLIE
jgi:thermitase